MSDANPVDLIKKYFPPDQWGNAYRVMQGESGGNPNAVGDTKEIAGITAPSVGLFQIRTLPGRPSAEQLQDPEFNVAYAAKLWKDQGWSPWTVAKNLGLANSGGSRMITIRNSQTGETKQVDESQLGQYGITPIQSSGGNVFQQAVQAGAEQKALEPVKTGIDIQSAQTKLLQDQAPQSLQQDLNSGMTLRDAVSKYSPYMKADDIFAQYQAVNASGKKGTYGPAKESPTELQAMEITTGTGTSANIGSAADRQGVKDAIVGIRDVADQWNKIVASGIPGSQNQPSAKEYETMLNLLGDKLAYALQKSRASQTVQRILDSLPKPGDLSNLTPGAAQAQFSGAEKILADTSGYSYKDLQLPEPSKSDQGKQNNVIGKVISGAGKDVQDIGQGIVSTIQQAVQGKLGYTPTEMIGNIAIESAKGLIRDYGELAPVSQDKNGNWKFDPGKTLNTLETHPIRSFLDLLPAAEVLGLKVPRLGKTGDAELGQVARPTTVPTTGNVIGRVIKGFSEKGAEALSGGGTKDFIAKNVNLDGAKSMSKVLLDRNILSKLTTKGRIEATAKSLTDTGKNLEKVFSSSKQSMTSGELYNSIVSELEKNYPDQPQIVNTIKAQLNVKGIIPDGTKSVSMDQVWNLRKGLDEWGPRQFNIPQSGPMVKQMAKDSSRVLRNILAEKVPESIPSLRDYGALKMYQDDILENPTGIDPKGFDSIIKFAAGMVERPLDVGLQKLYNLGKKLAPDETPIKSASSQLSKPKAIQSVTKPFLRSPEQMDFPQTQETPPGGIKPTIESEKVKEIIDKMPPAQQRRILMDLRTKLGEVRPRKGYEMLLQAVSKKKYQ